MYHLSTQVGLGRSCFLVTLVCAVFYDVVSVIRFSLQHGEESVAQSSCEANGSRLQQIISAPLSKYSGLQRSRESVDLAIYMVRDLWVCVHEPSRWGFFQIRNHPNNSVRNDSQVLPPVIFRTLFHV